MRQDLEDNLFDINSEYEDCECNSDHVNSRSVSVFDKSSYEETSEMSCDDNPVRTKKKNNLLAFYFFRLLLFFIGIPSGSLYGGERGKGGRKVNNNKLNHYV